MEEYFFRPSLKYRAKDQLRGRWVVAISITAIALILSGMLTAVSGMFTPEYNLSIMAEDPFGMTLKTAVDPLLQGNFSYEYYLEAPIIPVDNGSFFIIVLITTVLGLFLSGSYDLAFYKWMLDVQSGHPNNSFGDFVANFRYWLKGIGTYLWMTLWLFLWSLAFIIPISFIVTLFALGGAMAGTDGEAMALMLVLVISALLLAYAVLIVRKALSYSMMFFIVGDSPEEIGPIRAMEYSKTMTRGHLGDLFMLGLSFLGWLLLGLFTCGLAYLYVIPYMRGSFAQAYLWLRDASFDDGRLSPSWLGMQEEGQDSQADLTRADLADAARYERVNSMADASPSEAQELDRSLEQAMETDRIIMDEDLLDGPDASDERNSL